MRIQRRPPDLRLPVLGFWGDREERVPLESVAAYRAGLTARGVLNDISLSPGMRHAFLTFDPTHPDYSVAQETWNRTLRFLNDTLATERGG